MQVNIYEEYIKNKNKYLQLKQIGGKYKDIFINFKEWQVSEKTFDINSSKLYIFDPGSFDFFKKLKKEKKLDLE